LRESTGGLDRIAFKEEQRFRGAINQATYADAILDRLIRNAHHLDLSGESMRRPQAKKTDAAA
jgi:hypothetical protein